MTRSSEVVMRLNGCDATDGMFDLVFSRPQGEHAPHASHETLTQYVGCMVLQLHCESASVQ